MKKIYQTIKIQEISIDEMYDTLLENDYDNSIPKRFIDAAEKMSEVSLDTINDLDIEDFIFNLSYDESTILFLKSLGFRQCHIAEELGLSKGYISRISTKLKNSARSKLN